MHIYSPGGLISNDNIGFFTGQSDMPVTSLFQLGDQPGHPVYPEVSMFVSGCAHRCPLALTSDPFS